MSVFTVTLRNGRDASARQTVGERLNEAVTKTIAAPLDHLTGGIHQTPATHRMGDRRERLPGAAKNART